jgi:hypothetical protein
MRDDREENGDGRGDDAAARHPETEPDHGFDKHGGKSESAGSKRPYRVGYGKPPPEHRVKPGQRLNPSGRPKGSKNKPKDVSSNDVRAMVLREARRMVTVSDAQGPTTMPMAEMVYRSLGLRGAKGSVRAGRDFVLFAREAEREEANERTELLVAIGQYKLDYERLRRQYSALGGRPSSYLLDPDSMIIGPEGVLGFRDAATKEEKLRWRTARAEWKRELKDCKSQLAGLKGRKRARLQNEIQLIEYSLRIVDKALAGSRQAMWILEQGTVRDGDVEP